MQRSLFLVNWKLSITFNSIFFENSCHFMASLHYCHILNLFICSVHIYLIFNQHCFLKVNHFMVVALLCIELRNAVRLSECFNVSCFTLSNKRRYSYLDRHVFQLKLIQEIFSKVKKIRVFWTTAFFIQFSFIQIHQICFRI